MLFRWQKGRQQSGYDKMLLATTTWPIPFDFYLLKFDTGSLISPHTDKVSEGRHYRINIILRKAKRGGEFICKTPIFETSRFKFFRPDVSEHEVTEITAGRRYVLSFGWIKY